MTKPWKVNLKCAWVPINRCGRYRYQRVSSLIKKELKQITKKRRRNFMKTFDGVLLNNVRIYNPYFMDGNYYGKYFHNKRGF